MTVDEQQIRRDTREIMRWVTEYACQNERTPRQMVLALMNTSLSLLMIAVGKCSASDQARALAEFREMTEGAFEAAARSIEPTTRRMQ